MTQAPTPGPLTSESVKLLVKGDWISHPEHGTAQYWPSAAGDRCLTGPWSFVGRPDADGWIDHKASDAPPPDYLMVEYITGSGLTSARMRVVELRWDRDFKWRPFRLAPTAPVEASGSEREAWVCVDFNPDLRMSGEGYCLRCGRHQEEHARPQPSGETREAVARAIADGFSNGNEQYDEAGTLLQARFDMAADAVLNLHPLSWLDVKDAPQDGSEILLNHRTHGIIQGWFSKGEWSDDTPISPREYSGDMWILGDDLQQDEVEFGEHGEVVASGVLGWLPLNALLSTRPLALGGQHSGGKFTSVAGLWKDQNLSRLERVKAHRSEFGSELKQAVEAVDEETARQAIASKATPARAEVQDEGAAGKPVTYQRLSVTGWVDVAKEDIDHYQRRGQKIRPLYAHPSPTPAADADRVREAVTIIRDRLRQIWEGDTHLVYSGNPPEPSHDEEGDLAKLANEAVEALNSVFPVPDALAALKSTAAKEGEE